MSCCKATKLRDTVYGNEPNDTESVKGNTVGKWVIYIFLMLLSPLWGLPLIGVVLYKGIIKNEALEFIKVVKWLAKNKSNNRFSDHEVIK